MEPLEFLVGQATKRAAMVLQRSLTPAGVTGWRPPPKPIAPPSFLGGQLRRTRFGPAAMAGLGLGGLGIALPTILQGIRGFKDMLEGRRSLDQASAGR